MSIVNEIRKIPGLYHVKGCNAGQIEEAQKALGLTFPEEYIDYLKEYGAISFYGTEWMGLNVTGYLNVVEATMQERELNESFPLDWFVLENQGIDGLIVASDEKGCIYSIHYDKKEKIHDSLSEYLKSCIARAR